ncbi:aromatic prenyltransferase [Aspergillus costaricaensis CBS 115574]|uniref:Aromatic prenyltransferase n=1 Tax=Aspergillus costaricaensis CBS 115574 TaxID=1448317 RepID=A0ACD1IDK7_9EURO|nr:aromatic prenyltransferase [Aspergillus costaricaensis CBS 115574]RAK87873.1 aromatic prenyltransferase [Aspergillus costaricaensis CBS 115574]
MRSTVSDVDDFDSQLRVFDNVSKFLLTDDVDQVFWWQTTGRHFARMMHEARYPEARQVELLLFYRFVIAPRLGPRPISATPRFYSRVAPGVGDGSPIGYSWRWGTGPNSKPQIRHYIEAIGPLTGTTADPLNEYAAKEMLHQLGQLVPGVELPLAWKFAAHIRPSLTDESTRAVAGSSILIGLQCAPDSQGIDVMAGLMTRSPAQVPVLLHTIFPRAMRDAYGPDASLDGLNMVREFLEHDPHGQYLTILGTTAIDCCDAATSRFKVYVTTANTSFAHLAAVMTLGGRKPESPESLSQLQALWYALKALDPKFPTTAEAPSTVNNNNGTTTNGTPNNANVSGVTFYFDIHPKYSFPHIKLQVDVSKHTTSDLDAIHAVTEFLTRRGQGADAQAYINVVRAMISDEELRTRRGFQAFFAFAFKKGEVDITSYFLPQIYRRYVEIEDELALEEGNLKERMSPKSQRRSRFEAY